MFSKFLLRVLMWRCLNQARIRGYLCSSHTEDCIIRFESQAGFWQVRWCNQTVLICKEPHHFQVFPEIVHCCPFPTPWPRVGIAHSGLCSYLPHWKFKWGNFHYIAEFRVVFPKRNYTEWNFFLRFNHFAFLWALQTDVSIKRTSIPSMPGWKQKPIAFSWKTQNGMQ